MKNISVKFHVLTKDVSTQEGESDVLILEAANIFVDEVNCHVGDDIVTIEAKASIDGIGLSTIESTVEDAILALLTTKARIIKDAKFCTPFIASTDRILSSVLKAMVGEKVCVSLSNSKTKRTFSALGTIPKSGKISMDSFTFLY